MAKLKAFWQTVTFCLVLITVSVCQAESVSLSWDAPTTNADGTPLTDLAGYRVYYGTATGVYGTVIDVGNISCYVVSGLTVGLTYYFAATAYDTGANESDFSNEVSKAITTGMAGACGTGGIYLNWKSRHKTTVGFDGGFQ